MAARRRVSVSCLLLTGLVAALLMAELSSAGPIASKTKRDGGSLQERAAEQAASRQLVRQRRNISWYKQNADFWSWYKYFTDNGNQEALQELDRIYLAYLQNKNRAEGRRSYKAYLRHLGEIYKSCADSEDPKCVASYTTRPEPPKPKPAPVKTCDPTKDAYCLYAALLQGKSPYLPLVLPVAKAPVAAPVAAPAPVYARAAAPAKDPASGYYYFSPSVQPFLTQDQKAELLRICAAEDVECLQYHLKAAFGYKTAAGHLPSYAHLGCDPKKDPGCQPQLAQKVASGVYLKYPNCDPLKDPICAYAAALSAPVAPNSLARAGPGSCNPLFEDGCNPLTATKFASPPEEYKQEQKEEAAAAAIRAPPAPAEQRNDPYAMFRDAFAHAHANRAPDPYAMYQQASGQAAAQARDPYAMYRQAQAQANDPYAMYRQASRQASAQQENDPYAMYRQASPQANDPYAMYRQAAPEASDPYAMYRQPSPQANDPYAMHRQASSPASEQQESDPYAMYRQASSQAAAQENDPYAMYRQPSSPSPAQANDPYAMYRQAAPQANDPYAMYRQAAPQANDPYAMLRQLMSQAQSNDPNAPRMGAAPEVNANDPFAAFREASRRQGSHAARQNPFEQPAQEQHPLGPPGKTKEGYDCYIGYDRECFPVKPTKTHGGPHSRPHPAEPYEPHLNADGTRNGVMEPSNPDCDPEYDRDCRLRRFEPEPEGTAAEAQTEQQQQQHPEEEEQDRYHQGATESESEPSQSGQEEPYMPFLQQQVPRGMPSFQDMLRGYADRFPERGDQRAYADDYRKK